MEKTDAWFSLGVINFRKQDYKQSELLMKKTLEIDEENFSYWYYLGLSYMNRECLWNRREQQNNRWNLRGNLFRRLNFSLKQARLPEKWNHAGRFLKIRIFKWPENLKVIMRLEIFSFLPVKRRNHSIILKWRSGFLLILLKPGIISVLPRENQGCSTDAAYSIKKAMELSPKTPWIYTAFGLTQFKNKKSVDAEKILRRALELDPLSSYSHYLMGVILKEKKPGKAKDHLKKAISFFKIDWKACQNHGTRQMNISALQSPTRFPAGNVRRRKHCYRR